MLHIQDVRKNADGLEFDQSFDLLDQLKERNPEILDLEGVRARGRVTYEDGLYFLNYDLSYKITLASSRSMDPVPLDEDYAVAEIFMEEEGQVKKEDWLEDDLILLIEGTEIPLAESVADNILLNVPFKVLTLEEEAGQGFSAGSHWQVMSEEDYSQMQAEKQEANNPFAGLNGLFDEE